MKTLIIDGQWNLKRNFHRSKNQFLNFGKDDTVFNFLDCTRSAINKTLPDRVVVMWDGFNSGKYRYEMYRPYKANREKKWDNQNKAIISEGKNGESDLIDYQILLDKINVKNYLEDLFIRQLECDYIEADDLIAYYILNKKDDEKIIIYSRDCDYLQLISDDVSVLNPDNYKIITKENFKETFGYTIENELLFKCFEGDSSDNISGVKGVTRNNLLKNFPDMANNKYYFKELLSEASKKSEKKKLKLYEKILSSTNIVYRNAQLMNLKKPFMDDGSKVEVLNIINSALEMEDRDIKNAISRFISDGFIKKLYQIDFDLFFSPFYRIFEKEKDFNLKNKSNK